MSNAIMLSNANGGAEITTGTFTLTTSEVVTIPHRLSKKPKSFSVIVEPDGVSQSTSQLVYSWNYTLSGHQIVTTSRNGSIVYSMSTTFSAYDARKFKEPDDEYIYLGNTLTPYNFNVGYEYTWIAIA